MKEGGGTDQDKDLNPDEIEVEVDLSNQVNIDAPQVQENNRLSNIGMSHQKMKPGRPDNLSPENDVFEGAGAANTASDAKHHDEFGSSAEF